MIGHLLFDPPKALLGPLRHALLP
uniref:Uncharacterized protein n=1 Tax=Rhizophora mucronata TaxID=61149 RepID=A0A2P2N6W4_RHIMU